MLKHLKHHPEGNALKFDAGGRFRCRRSCDCRSLSGD